MTKRVSIFAFPLAGISYTECFYASLLNRGINVRDGHFSLRWLLKHARSGDWMHFHWPSFSYSEGRGRVRLLRAFARWTIILLALRAMGVRCVWTAHNLLPHDSAEIPAMDRLGRRVMIALSEHVFVHGAHAARCVTDEFPAAAGKMTLIPFGNWIGYYPCSMTRQQARADFGFTDADYVYLFFGLCKPYKNLDGLVQAFRKLEGRVALLIVGKFPDAQYLKLIRTLCGDDPRIRLENGYVPDDQLGRYFRACNAVVAPYHEILTSGTVVLAHSFGLPVVSIAKGFLLDVVTKDNGVLYDPKETTSLPNALNRVRTIEFSEREIQSGTALHTFDDAARIFCETLNL
jgi:beta-1,4-mannosyltransferase